LLAYLLPLSVALSWCLARAASASCEVALDGDPEIVEDVQAALFTFGRDDVPCVVVRALCSRDANDLVIDLQDQLGRSVQRRFRTPVGAAAFLISWSRRPLPQDGTDFAAPPAAAPSVAESPAAAPPTPPAAVVAAQGSPPGMTPEVRSAGTPAPHLPSMLAADGWHPELRAAYLPGLAGPAGFVEGALLRHRGIWHYGADLRVVSTAALTSRSVSEGIAGQNYANVAMWLSGEAVLVAGVRGAYGPLVVRGELTAGAAYVTLLSGTISWHFQALGARGGGRLTIASPLISSLWLEAGAGVDALLTGTKNGMNYLLGPDRLQAQGHVEVGLVWVL